MIKTKSTEDPASSWDGLRLFVTRYWPRGHRRDECDEWILSLAPSETLLHRFQSGEIDWKKFREVAFHGVGASQPVGDFGPIVFHGYRDGLNDFARTMPPPFSFRYGRKGAFRGQ